MRSWPDSSRWLHLSPNRIITAPSIRVIAVCIFSTSLDGSPRSLTKHRSFKQSPQIITTSRWPPKRITTSPRSIIYHSAPFSEAAIWNSHRAQPVR
ncbi:protein of unknown function (plasmid) [Azospirillum lipoferum 4B]|uniref:Uncharacterized protein n=1 Tax=Azospirillum lipoferum (strain 4B) TaxID=862719 RepID=G7ZB47_AZOL4|nr:protein of unknown function [Azospirillum lipoferum 4B]